MEFLKITNKIVAYRKRSLKLEANIYSNGLILNLF